MRLICIFELYHFNWENHSIVLNWTLWNSTSKSSIYIYTHTGKQKCSYGWLFNPFLLRSDILDFHWTLICWFNLWWVYCDILRHSINSTNSTIPSDYQLDFNALNTLLHCMTAMMSITKFHVILSTCISAIFKYDRMSVCDSATVWLNIN